MQILILELKMFGSVKNETILLEVLTFLLSAIWKATASYILHKDFQEVIW